MKRSSNEKLLGLGLNDRAAILQVSCSSEDSEVTIYRHKGDPNPITLTGSSTVTVDGLSQYQTIIVETDFDTARPVITVVEPLP